MKKYIVIILLSLGLVSLSGFAYGESGKIEEIKQYFELRDTISLINLEMKRAMATDSRSPMLYEKNAEQTLTSLLQFIEQRIKQFSESNTSLKYHYLKKLGGLFNETRQLYSAVLVKMRTRLVAEQAGSLVSSTKNDVVASDSHKLQPRPFFHPIDLRTLLSPALLNANKFKVETAKPSVASATAQAPKPTTNKSAAPANNAAASAVIAKEIKSAPVATPKKPVMQPISPTTVVTAQIAAPAVPIKDSVASVAITPLPIATPILAPITASVTAPIAPITASVKTPIAPPTAAPATTPIVAPAITPVVENNASAAAIAPDLKQPRIAVATEPTTASITPEIVKPAAVAPAGEGFMRPLSIMIENHNKSRPQSALDQADMVYEMPVEGGITRFMAIFNKLPQFLGPVRSCREYFIDRALEIDALYVHCGASPSGYAYLSKSGINSVDEIKNSPPFYRDNTRKAPHNLYAKGSGIYDYMAARVPMRLKQKPVLFKKIGETIYGPEVGQAIKIRYHGNYNLEIKFENGAYQRYMNDVLHVDRITEKPLQIPTVVIQIASMKTVDKEGRQEISFIGSGTAWIMENGRMTKVTWSKATPRTITSYKDQTGAEYAFSGKLPVWVQVVSPLHKIYFNGESTPYGIVANKGDDVKGAAKNGSDTESIGKQG